MSLGHPDPDERLRQSLLTLLEVERISAVSQMPLAGMPGRVPAQVDQRSFALELRSVDAEYFATTDIRIVHGRAFQVDEANRTLPVAIAAVRRRLAIPAHADPVPRGLQPQRLPAHAAGSGCDCDDPSVAADPAGWEAAADGGAAGGVSSGCWNQDQKNEREGRE